MVWSSSCIFSLVLLFFLFPLFSFLSLFLFFFLFFFLACYFVIFQEGSFEVLMANSATHQTVWTLTAEEACLFVTFTKHFRFAYFIAFVVRFVKTGPHQIEILKQSISKIQ